MRLDSVRKTSPAIVAIVTLAALAFPPLGLLVYDRGWLRPVEAATGELVTLPLILNAAALLIIVAGLVLRLGRLRAADVGLDRSKLAFGAVVTLCLWLLAQIIGAAAAWIAGEGVTLDPAWSESVSRPIGELLGQLCGNAVFEEAIYRGLLLPQLYLLFASRFSKRPTLRLAAALLASQALFAIEHIPLRLYQDVPPADLPWNLAMTAVYGGFLCWIYLSTGNLFIAIGVHALINAPTPVLACGVEPHLVIYSATLAVLILRTMIVRAHRAESNPSARE